MRKSKWTFWIKSSCRRLKIASIKSHIYIFYFTVAMLLRMTAGNATHIRWHAVALLLNMRLKRLRSVWQSAYDAASFEKRHQHRNIQWTEKSKDFSASSNQRIFNSAKSARRSRALIPATGVCQQRRCNDNVLSACASSES